MRLIAACSLFSLCVLSMRLGVASEPRILTEARNLNRARDARINAEIVLQKTIVNARQSLLDEGYAAPLEVDAPKTRLRELQSMRSQIREYEAFLEQVSESCYAQAEQTSRPSQRPIEQMEIGLPMPSSYFRDHPPLVVETTDELKSLSEQLAILRLEAKGELRALAAERAYLESLLTRLLSIDDGSVALRREMELAEMRLAVQRCRIEMGRAQQRYGSCRELLHQEDNSVGLPIRLGDEEITDSRRLSTILESQWNFHRVESEREAVVVRMQMQSTYQDQLLALEQANVGRPGEAWLWESAHDRTSHELAQLNHRLSQLDRLGSSMDSTGRQRPRQLLPDGHAELSHSGREHVLFTMENDHRIQAAIAAARQQITQLAPFAQENATASELARTKLELAVYEAEWRVRREEQTLWSRVAQSAIDSDSSKTRGASFVTKTEDTSAPRSQRAGTSLVSWFRARAENSGRQNLAECHIELLEWKLAGLQPLRELGYATWKEVAAAERDLAQARAYAIAAQEERRIAEMEYQRILAATAGDSSESEVAVLVR